MKNKDTNEKRDHKSMPMDLTNMFELLAMGSLSVISM